MICSDTPEDIARAAELLRAGKLVAFPTETVYGLGADASNPEASRGIFAAKGRPADHPLIVHLADAEQLPGWAREIPKEAIALARAFWPGPLTLILKKEADVPDVVTGGQDTVGLRVPDHPVALALLRVFGGGVAGPSANRFGRISPTTAQHVQEELGDAVAMILEGGACEVGIESTILDLSRGELVLLRPGMIGRTAIEAVIGRPVRLKGEGEAAPRVSGALAAHYAPRTPMRMASSAEIAVAAGDCAVLTRAGESAPGRYVMAIDAPFDAHGYAHELYANLRALDASGAREILVQTLPDDSAWDAVHDRLGRAVVGSGTGRDET
ncbi:MAG: threonylcarbamoyl-AMP synthase [Candidatus Dactylopiibacterium carminicum]|uniref:Threonylcarbamoyl-AMP synthase n=1 Tax=Candidatus Dactylopiibacterium carminicum TaxID=857335 RepID=A0A272EML3_9RHOO|nr:L-threonylcarbamoyladenylate synthase [Candidatus Dactylopiibacterium carminicum]KAF7597762.1 L-threonylcarbamoyladenylate synthase [Candidatus Dactylopiibacterium carminicum]PAS91351.1 MAG: threonylcarbamoyl-AMP synthase [Candidatus Dactylopiibacterium carminicum]PAS92268.1 MAG: threonylcarbamoyl-AMP synthase [Candidatus Dactylopiibacterium carminicum]PAS95425.1 MAG: threonylcarbamoyl-AMP synthase [Candidatus Dactylopiibacterium carminicum]